MKKALTKRIAMVFLSLCLAFTVEAGAMTGDMNHDAMQNMDHSGMEMGGEEIMLGEDVQGNVKAITHLRDISEAMSEAGMDMTHHFMVMFKDASSGDSLEQGVVALKVIDPAGQRSAAVKLMGMDGSFGADVALPQKGKYVFEVGTKLADGKKRQYRFHYIVE